MYWKCQNYSWFIGKWQVVIRLYMVAVYTILEAYWILLNQKCSRQQLYGSPLPGSSAALETWLMYTARRIPRMLQHSKTAMIKIKYPFTWASFSLIHRFQAALWHGWSFTMALCTYSWRCLAAQDDNGTYCHQAVAAYGAPQFFDRPFSFRENVRSAEGCTPRDSALSSPNQCCPGLEGGETRGNENGHDASCDILD